jgi:hypothetical protein
VTPIGVGLGRGRGFLLVDELSVLSVALRFVALTDFLLVVAILMRDEGRTGMRWVEADLF